ncbi:sigma-E factor negative regulatory protein [Cobetia sp. L2A1]|uniref:sigma-E factor negative regulatory protein n=1 Tax=Cobetia sp. L2A1 TaxID=2686360 RepID=UPI00131AC013|nr:sigma-E factor negative regulatory protein [Cobetia sp. L2A1]
MNLKTTESVKESLSALMDAEGDELDLRRVLKGLDESPEAADTWRRYHLARSAMHRERESVFTMDIAAAVSAEVEMVSREVPAVEPVAERRSLFSFAGSAAIAAGVAVMVITGVQVFNGSESGVPTSVTGGAELASSVPGSESAELRQVSQSPANAEVPQWSLPAAGNGLMQVGATSMNTRPMFMAPQGESYGNQGMSSSNVAAADLAQRRLLEAYLSKHSARGPVPERSEWISLQDVAQ